MHIEIIGDGDALTPGLCTYAERRLRYVLARYAGRVTDVLAQLSVTDAALGRGIDVFARIAAWGRSVEGHVTTASGSNPVAAIDQAADRLRRDIGRELMGMPTQRWKIEAQARLAS